MRATGWTGRVSAAVALAAPLLLASCGGGGDEGAAASLGAAMVPGADLVVRVDVGGLRDASIFAGSEPEEPVANDPAEGGDTDFDGARFLEITGLTPDDVVSVLVTADLDDVDVESEAPGYELDGVNGVAGVRLSRALDLDTLEKGLRESVRGDAPPAITRIEVGGTAALRIDSQDEEEPDVFVASFGDGQTLFAAPNQESLAGALARASSGDLAALSADLERVHAALPAGAQARVGFVVSQKIRDAVAKQIDEPGNAMAAGFAAPFRDLRSLSFGVEAAQSLTVALAGDLGADEAAQQAKAMLGGMLAPMAKAALAEALGRPPAEIDDRLAVTADASTLDITLRLSAEDVAAYRAKQAEKAAAEE
jgi:hypothetical protein